MTDEIQPTKPKTMLDVGGPVPKSLGGIVDLYHDVRDLRLMMEKEVEPIQKRESELREMLIAQITKGAEHGVVGARHMATVDNAEKFTVTDWGVLRSWVRKNDRFDVLGKSIVQKAVADFFKEEKRLLPGTEKVLIPTLSVVKRK